VQANTSTLYIHVYCCTAGYIWRGLTPCRKWLTPDEVQKSVDSIAFNVYYNATLFVTVRAYFVRERSCLW